jgi:triosephosphate isomerase
LLYGGSVDETNASNILSIDNVDGFLVGSASIKSNSFYNIYNKF